MVSRLRLCSAIQAARASASATVPIASTSTASYSPKTKVDVIGSKPSASPKGFGRSPTIAFPGAVKTFTLSEVGATGGLRGMASFSPFLSSTWCSFRFRASDCSRKDWQKGDAKSIGRTYRRYQGTGQISGAGYPWGDQLVQQRFPIGRNSPCRSGCRLIQGMRMRRKQLLTLDRRPRLVIVEPILTRLKTGY